MFEHVRMSYCRMSHTESQLYKQRRLQYEIVDGHKCMNLPNLFLAVRTISVETCTAAIQVSYVVHINVQF